jgi:hypothetical protein
MWILKQRGSFSRPQLFNLQSIRKGSDQMNLQQLTLSKMKILVTGGAGFIEALWLSVWWQMARCRGR